MGLWSSNSRPSGQEVVKTAVTPPMLTPPPAMSHTPGAKALRIAIDASAEAEANRISAEAWKRKAEEAESRCLSVVAGIDVALEAYRTNKMVPQKVLVDWLLEIRKRAWEAS